MPEATHKISACYFPNTGEIELSWENIKSNEIAIWSTKIPHDRGEKITSVVPCGTFWGAIVKDDDNKEKNMDNVKIVMAKCLLIWNYSLISDESINSLDVTEKQAIERYQNDPLFRCAVDKFVEKTTKAYETTN